METETAIPLDDYQPRGIVVRSRSRDSEFAVACDAALALLAANPDIPGVTPSVGDDAANRVIRIVAANHVEDAISEVLAGEMPGLMFRGL